jgi:hypothetical protein
MKNLIDLQANVASSVAALTETVGVKSQVTWEHPDVAGHFVKVELGYGGVSATRGNVGVGIAFDNLWGLLSTKEPGLLPVLPNVAAAPPNGAAPQSVTLSCSQANANIHFTLNGDEPTANSNVASGAVAVGAALTLKAKAFKANWQGSNTMSFVYT